MLLMPSLWIDGREIPFSAGATILEVAHSAGIEIPTLCYQEGCPPSTSCLVCVVRLDSGKLVPSCATKATDGLRVECDTDEVRRVRTAALELLLSDHLGDCIAPCRLGCPAGMDIPAMLRAIAEGDTTKAAQIVRRDIAIPAVLGRICPAPCEKVCRRGTLDAAVSICGLKRFTADATLALPASPETAAPSQKKVAVVGAGPTGVCAAFYLNRAGHSVSVFESRSRPGGRLLEIAAESGSGLSMDVLEAEMAQVLAGIDLRLATRIGPDISLDVLRGEYDAVLLALGAEASGQAGRWNLPAAGRGLQVLENGSSTVLDGVFAAGMAVRGKGMVIRSAADGKEAAAVIDRHLRGSTEDERANIGAYTTKVGRLTAEETQTLFPPKSGAERQETPADGFAPDDARTQAARCLGCGCMATHKCRLRTYAAEYGAQPGRYRGSRRRVGPVQHACGVVYEPGKCIDCGLCTQITSRSSETLGLTFVGRGFNVQVSVPFNGPLEEALGPLAEECVNACPTAALRFDK